MSTLLVYESMFGNTEVVAKAVAEGLGGDVVLAEVGDAPATIDPEVDLLVVGGPTHAFSMTRASTRADAGKQAHGRPLVSTGIGIREWLEALEPPRGPVAATTFDTKVKKPVPGSAAKAALKRLRKLGFGVAAPATTFYVDDVEGPLLAGEEDRARQWGATLTR